MAAADVLAPGSFHLNVVGLPDTPLALFPGWMSCGTWGGGTTTVAGFEGLDIRPHSVWVAVTTWPSCRGCGSQTGVNDQ